MTYAMPDCNTSALWSPPSRYGSPEQVQAARLQDAAFQARFTTPAPSKITATSQTSLTGQSSPSHVEAQMSVGTTITTLRALLPVIRFAVETVEESGILSGSEKLTAALGIVKDLVTDSGIEQAWDLIEPTVKRTVSAVVAFWNLTGKFRHKAAK